MRRQTSKTINYQDDFRAKKDERLVGTVSRGVRAPIIRQGDDLAAIVVDSVLAAAKSEGFELRDKELLR